MTEVVSIDRQRLLESKRQEWISIARSRKRKLRELYAVATTAEGIPKCSFADPDIPITDPGERQFLEAPDLPLDRKLDDANIPPRPKFRFDVQRPPQPNGATQRSQTTTSAANFGHNDSNARPPSAPSSAASQKTALGAPLSIVPSRLTVAPSQEAASQPPQPTVPPQPIKGSTRPILSPLNNEQSQPKLPPPTQGQPINGTKSPTASGVPVGLPPNTQNGLLHPGSAQPTPIQPSQPDAHKGYGHDGVQRVEDVTDARSPSDLRHEATSPLSPTHPPDASRPTDAFSSPASTPQTGTTPAVMDTSANTSPDHEAVQFLETNHNGAEDGQQETLPTFNQQAQSVLPSKTEDSERVQSAASAQMKPELGSRTALETKSDHSNGGLEASSIPPPKAPFTTVPDISVKNVDKPASTQHTHVQFEDPGKAPYDLSNGVFAGANGLHRALQPVQLQTTTEKPAPHKISFEQSVRSSTGPLTPSGDHVETSQQTTPQATEPPTTSPIHLHPDYPALGSSTTSTHQKSVAEVLAENPKPAPLASASSNSESHAGPITPVSQTFKGQSRSLIRKAKPKDRSKMSTVIFGKQPRSSSDATRSLVQNRPRAGQAPGDDYFTPLFIHGFTGTSKWMKPLDQILHHAHKTVSTPDQHTPVFEHQACRVLRSVYNLQQHNKWSLRQPKRWPEPIRQPSHWDQVLKEMKWLRTDFREERKWKMAAARNLANACADWYHASTEDRKTFQVNAFIPPVVSSNSDDISMADHIQAQDPEDHATPELIPSGESDSPPMELEEEPHQNILDTVAPSAIFALQEDDIVFALHHSPTTDRLLEELPMYGSPLTVLKSDLMAPDYDPDASWRRPALPLSKYVEGEMVLAPSQHACKRSRYRYAQEEDEDGDGVIFGSSGEKQAHAEPENTDVALFRPENKTIRDRLHAGHQFRPPNEYTMPFQTFYECRSYSQWTQSEDDELKSLVREYSYNWSLISSMLASRSLFVSGAERRTPWECFERWVMLEGLPNDMQKTQYFKLWQSRIEAAQQTLRQQHQNATQQHAQQQQQAGANGANGANGVNGATGPATPMPKKRLSLPLKVERRRNQKHLTMIDAMRKLAKKRETAVHKQQQAAAQAAMRKQNEAPQPKITTKTPREYSIMRWERDQAMAERLAERMAQHRQHQEAQRKVRNAATHNASSNANAKQQAVLQARAQQAQAAQMAASQSAGQRPQSNPPMAASHPHAAMGRTSAPNPIPVNGQARPRMPMHTPNGTGSPGHVAGGLVPPMQMNGSPQMQMPVVNGQSQMAMPNSQQPDVRLLIQAQRIQEQQRQSVQMRQQTHQGSPGATPMQNSPQAMRAAALSGLNQKSYLNNAQAQAMMASMNGANGSGMATPPPPTFPMSAGQSASPPPNATLPQPSHQTYVSQLQHIENHIRQQHPNTPQEMVRQMARQLLQTRHNSMAQSAMNAAAGGQGQAAVANGPHQYAQLLRAQQQQQAAAAAQAAQQQSHQTHQAHPTHPTHQTHQAHQAHQTHQSPHAPQHQVQQPTQHPNQHPNQHQVQHQAQHHGLQANQQGQQGPQGPHNQQQPTHTQQAIQAQHQRHTSGSATPTPAPPVAK